MKIFTKCLLVILLPVYAFFITACSKEESEPNKAPVIESSEDIIGITNTDINLKF